MTNAKSKVYLVNKKKLTFNGEHIAFSRSAMIFILFIK